MWVGMLRVVYCRLCGVGGILRVVYCRLCGVGGDVEGGLL